MIVFQQSPVVTDGGRTMVDVSDDDQEDILYKILVELKKANFHLTVLSDNDLDGSEVE